MSVRVRIAIAGAGVSGFATLGYLVKSLQAVSAAEVTIYWLQSPRIAFVEVQSTIGEGAFPSNWNVNYAVQQFQFGLSSRQLRFNAD